MLSTVEAIYQDGEVIFTEKPKIEGTSRVLITFLDQKKSEQKLTSRKLGTFKGMIRVPDDFNDSMDEDFECLR